MRGGSHTADTRGPPGRHPGVNARARRRSASWSRSVGQPALMRMNPGVPKSRPSEGPRPAASHAACGSETEVPRQSIQARYVARAGAQESPGIRATAS